MAKEHYTTEIEDFLSAEDIEAQYDKADLEEALALKKSVGAFNVWTHNGQTFIKGSSEATLRLVTAKAVKEFKRQLHEVEVEDEDDPDAGYRRAMENPHA